jgi:hypothetical protein
MTALAGFMLCHAVDLMGSVTGFVFVFHRLLPSHIVGMLSFVGLANLYFGCDEAIRGAVKVGSACRAVAVGGPRDPHGMQVIAMRTSYRIADG